MPRGDRAHLALGQQNGLTAIVLALALQPYLPSAVGIIAMAVLTVNVLHLVTNGAWDLMRQAPTPSRSGLGPQVRPRFHSPDGGHYGESASVTITADMMGVA